MSLKYRTDADSLGEVQVPMDAYYGPFTTRAMQQYRITHTPPHKNYVKSFVMIKNLQLLPIKN